MHPFTGPKGLVFPSVRTYARPISENTVNAALRLMGYAKDEMTGHGFRSMASTLLNEQGWPPDAIERQLAHIEQNDVRAAYNYAEYLPQRREMMQAWADYLDSLRGDQTRAAAEMRMSDADPVAEHSSVVWGRQSRLAGEQNMGSSSSPSAQPQRIVTRRVRSHSV